MHFHLSNSSSKSTEPNTSKNIPNFKTDFLDEGEDEDEYEKLNIVSFKKSFSKLQRNYSHKINKRKKTKSN